MNNRLILLSNGILSDEGFQLLRKVINSNSKNNQKVLLVSESENDIIYSALINKMINLGFARDCIATFNSNADISRDKYDYIYIGEGKLYNLISKLSKCNNVEVIRKAILNGTTYIGASAGAAIVSSDLQVYSCYENELVRVKEKGLSLMGEGDIAIFPHYSYSESKRLIQNIELNVNDYSSVYNIRNDELLVLNIAIENNKCTITNTKRMRLESGY